MKLPLPDRLRNLAGEPWPLEVNDPSFDAVNRAMHEAADELTRLVDRVERLRGLCKSAAGWLFDAGRHEEAERVLKLVGDMEDAALARMCRKCGGAMKPGIATEQTTSISDEGTCSTGGPGRVIDCMKCSACGWSVTA